jgi:ketosteroid isomerase-like protein
MRRRPPDRVTIAHMTATNVELARTGFEAAVAGDFEAIGLMLDDDVKWHAGDPTAIGACQNRGQALDFMRQAYNRGGIGELVDVVGAGDTVVVVMRPPPPREGGAELVANLTTFSAGKVVEMVHYPSVEDAFAAAGISG